MLEARFTKKLWHFTLDIRINLGTEILVLWGPSGAGKTTILHCLAGLSSPGGGLIKLGDTVLYSSEERINVNTRFRNVGYLFQDYALFPHLTVRQNVLYGVKCKRKKDHDLPGKNPLELLEPFGVSHLIDRYPTQLSGGEKQRVALARALAVQPQLLLLDEPFSALDRNIKENLRQEIKKLHRKWKIPFVLVTHDEEDAGFLGDKIISLEKGRSSDTPLQTISEAASGLTQSMP
ncbi:molybdenum transport ATP-binding protein ModC [Desulfocucumis palustris]|uniref:Molybdenum transport ATP-binding protein ModC n=1 Tax=Desulfocucumis palustris TaxID=1898651 RepID=A0A2L2XFQ5_9FIRM|nr:ATP-binding cassette domain-containing protein [Desulfocucumis palustris]GBF35189.1 molybdenum transport ATP-binding protein ModC [Desulfocucumis palustris]